MRAQGKALVARQPMPAQRATDSPHHELDADKTRVVTSASESLPDSKRR